MRPFAARARTVDPVDVPGTSYSNGYPNYTSSQAHARGPGRRNRVAVTLIKGPGYKGASLFGTTSKKRRHANGCDKIAMDDIMKGVVFRKGGVQLVSLPKACSVHTFDPRRTCITRRLRDKRVSTIVGILSMGGLRHGLLLAVRLGRHGVPLIKTLGVFSRFRTDRDALGVRRLDQQLSVPLFDAMTHGHVNVARILDGSIRLTRGRVRLRGSNIRKRGRRTTYYRAPRRYARYRVLANGSKYYLYSRHRLRSRRHCTRVKRVLRNVCSGGTKQGDRVATVLSHAFTGH